MKKFFVTASLFVFWAVVVAVIVAGLVSSNEGGQAVIKTNETIGQMGTTAGGADTVLSEMVLSIAEVAKHNSNTSCWLLISGKIYDVTSYVRQHPGGSGEILRTCGTDATAAYTSRGGTGSHSSSAVAMLSAYYIGDLNQNVTTSSLPAKPSSVTIPNQSLPSFGGSWGDDGYEDEYEDEEEWEDD